MIKKISYILATFLIALIFFFSFSRLALGEDPIDKLAREIKDLESALSLSKAATAPHEAELNRIKTRVAFIEQDLIKKGAEIDEGYKNLEKQKVLLDGKIVKYYINSYKNCQFCLLLGSSIETIINNLAYQQALIEKDKEELINFALTIADLEQKKNNLESEQTRLADIKIKLDKLVTGAKAYQASLSSKIAQLTAQQQSLIAQRLNALGIPRSAGTGAPACVDDRDKDPGFGPRIAFFTYGVPNRTGLNQYGAWGRAKAGQDHKAILNAYYTNFELKEDYDQNIQIHVVDSGIDVTMNIEEYVKRIYEMPSSWVEKDRAALKAQAIAARSYALSYTNNGQNSICATEKCQVFKTEPKGGDWDAAVEATRGDVMVQGGTPVKAWYSSTHGGYIFSTGELPGWSATSWTKHATDTTTGSAGSFSELNSNAYDRDSPWFYCDWGSRAQYNKTAWLKQEEVADITNVILLAQADSSTKEKLYQVDKQHPYGGEIWDQERVKTELRNRGITPFNTVNNISIGADFGGGKTTSVNVSGDSGARSFSGNEFKDWFNLRAPANIQIVGPLFNAEQR